MTAPLIQTRALTRVYRVGDLEVRALDGVTLTIARGEFVAIMGASGSGKSTLLAILGCLDRPTSGDYLLEGRDVGAFTDDELAHLRNKSLGFVFQSFNLLPISATENVAMPLEYDDESLLSHAQCLARARAALRQSGLAGLEDRAPSRMSGGQQQRVAIARALVHAPMLVLADEPTGNLDTATSHQIMDTLLAANRDQAVTVILVTHESDIAAYADRIIIMEDGRIISDESPAGVLRSKI